MQDIGTTNIYNAKSGHRRQGLNPAAGSASLVMNINYILKGTSSMMPSDEGCGGSATAIVSMKLDLFVT